MVLFALFAALQLGRAAASPAVARDYTTPYVNRTTCNGKTYTYERLAGWGLLASDVRDKYGDTIGGIGSAIALEKSSWKKQKGNKEAYEAVLYGLPDRGWNTNGTQNTQNRIHKFTVTLDIVSDGTAAKPAAPNFKFKYLDTILLYGPDGTPTTGTIAWLDR